MPLGEMFLEPGLCSSTPSEKAFESARVAPPTRDALAELRLSLYESEPVAEKATGVPTTLKVRTNDFAVDTALPRPEPTAVAALEPEPAPVTRKVVPPDPRVMVEFAVARPVEELPPCAAMDAATLLAGAKSVCAAGKWKVDAQLLELNSHAMVSDSAR